MGRIYRKGRFKLGMKEWGGDGILIIISMNDNRYGRMKRLG